MAAVMERRVTLRGRRSKQVLTPISGSEENIIRSERIREKEKSIEDVSKMETGDESSDDEPQDPNESSVFCISCRASLTEDRVEHPWLYGPACSDCLLICKTAACNWSANSTFQCEKCDDTNDLTIFNHRLLCYKCVGKVNIYSLPKLRHDWIQKVLLFKLKNAIPMVDKRPLRVLSMFDGIGTGLLVLDALGLEIEEYFSCEVNDGALDLLDFHYSGRIKHLGDVSNLTIPKLRSLGRIDLLLGGSPCNQLSLANPARKGLYDPVETGVLFFDFNRVLKFLEVEAMSRGEALFWLFENVASMPHAFANTISRTLQCKPAKWDGIQFLPAKRERLFWGNIPELQRAQDTDKPPPSLDEILEPYRKALVPTLSTITTTFHSQQSGKAKQLPVIQNGEESGLLITEIERLFGFPTHYTDGPNLSITQRRGLLGRAWCVPVIKEILTPLTKIYKTKNT